MNLITKEVDSAIRTIVEIAVSENEILTTSELATKLKVPRPFLRKVMQVLAKNDLLISIKGNKGGFKLIKDVCNIYLIDIMRLYQGKITLAECLFRNKVCPNRKYCVLRKKIKIIEYKMIKELEKLRIIDLINDYLITK